MIGARHEASNGYACRRTVLCSKNILKTANLINKGIYKAETS